MSAASSFAQALTDAGARLEFQHDGFIYTQGVPPECVVAYAAARVEKADAAAILARIVRSVWPAGHDIPPDDPRVFTWMCARAWAARLGTLERHVRGMAEVRR